MSVSGDTSREVTFGTIKSWMGATHIQLKTLKRVATEMALHVLAYNLKRVVNILGINQLMAAMRGCESACWE